MSEPRHRIVHGDSRDVLASMREACIDAVVTDPPYELAFMGKSWDSSGISFDPEFWRLVYRVLKPGGHLLAFGGTRTWHRIAVAIEDAGFELRDTCMWVFGCLSDDTEILTRDGWVRYDRAKEGVEVLAFNAETERTSWESVQRVYCYPYSGSMLRLSSNETDQLLTPNHKVLLSVKGQMSYLPCMRAASMDAESVVEEGQAPDLFLPMQRSAAWGRMEETRLQGESGMDCGVEKVLPREDVWAKQSRLERRSYHFQEAWQLLRSSLRSRTDLGKEDGTQGRLCDGASIADGRDVWLPPQAHGGSQSREPQAVRQQAREPNAVAVESRPQTVRMGEDSQRSTLSYTAVTASLVDYAGVVWCVKVPSGAFVARRNGKIFITGNSGFPKSLDVSKAIDKRLGATREATREAEAGVAITFDQRSSTERARYDLPVTKQAAQWEGYGTALKPAYEPILMFRKPLDGTVAENVLKHDTGGLNIDGSRVGAVGGTRSAGEPAYKNQIYGKGMGGVPAVGSAGGRWPANLILGCACENERAHDEDCPVRMLDEQGEGRNVHSAGSRKAAGGWNSNGGWGFIGKGEYGGARHGDSGGGSRFFYVAKASRLERELGLLGGVPPLTPPAVEHHGEGSKGLQSPRAGTGRTSGPIRNTHATVKPLLLMRYLIKLVTPPGGIVLDPFLGSGTTAVAAKVEGFSALGIEQDERYVLISRNALKVPLVRRMQKLAEASRREAREARGLKSTPLFDE